VAEQATERMVVAASPGRCFAVAADIERYPDWAVDIKDVTVHERDAEGRPSLVTFAPRPWPLDQLHPRYDYELAPKVLAWRQTQGDITTKLDGSYVFSEGTPGAPTWTTTSSRAAGADPGLHQDAAPEQDHVDATA